MLKSRCRVAARAGTKVIEEACGCVGYRSSVQENSQKAATMNVLYGGLWKFFAFIGCESCC